MQDVVAEYPNPILELVVQNSPRLAEVEHQHDFIARISNERFFIHARATLPLKDIDQGVGFGLWIEVDQPTYEQYLAVVDDDQQYQHFVAEGRLAQEWPGFLNSEGLRVRVRTIRLEEKIYVTEVLDVPADIALQTALLMQADDTHQKELVQAMVLAYVQDQQQGQV